MAKQNNIDEGPACACGKADLYEEWLKNENKKKEASDTSEFSESEDSSNSSGSAAKQD